MTIFENISLINYLNKFVKFNFLHFSNERAAKEEKKDHYKKWKLIEKISPLYFDFFYIYIFIYWSKYSLF